MVYGCFDVGSRPGFPTTVWSRTAYGAVCLGPYCFGASGCESGGPRVRRQNTATSPTRSLRHGASFPLPPSYSLPPAMSGEGGARESLSNNVFGELRFTFVTLGCPV